MIRMSGQYGMVILADEVYQMLHFASVTPPIPFGNMVPECMAPIPSEPTSYSVKPSLSLSPSSSVKIFPSIELTYPCVVSVSSFSKICCPGIRCGWVQGSQAMVKLLAVNGMILSGYHLFMFIHC
jgi:DNA-binding transcriptional MocR family regulator